MLYHAKNGRAAGTDYIRFGTGREILVILPGLGDGLRTVRGTALPMAWMYRSFAKDFTVFCISRKSELLPDHSTRDMARDLKEAMEALGIKKAHVLGVSMGGMIAQWLAIDHPEKVDRLVLTVTASRPNPVLTASIGKWSALARLGDHTALMDSNLRRIYSPDYYRRNKWMIPLVGKLTKPTSYDRFLIQAAACLDHDAFSRLPQIHVPTLVIGGEQDLALGPEASREIAHQIPGAQLNMYPQWGHGLYEEAPDFNQRVLNFLRRT